MASASSAEFLLGGGAAASAFSAAAACSSLISSCSVSSGGMSSGSRPTGTFVTGSSLSWSTSRKEIWKRPSSLARDRPCSVLPEDSTPTISRRGAGGCQRKQQDGLIVNNNFDFNIRSCFLKQEILSLLAVNHFQGYIFLLRCMLN